MSADTVYKYQIDSTVELTRMCCRSCGIQYAIPTAVDNYNAEQGASAWWYCPNGHKWHYRETTAARLERELEQARRATASTRAYLAEVQARLESERRSSAAHKGQATKLRNRARAGMCADCRRRFADYAQHMADVHGATNGAKPGARRRKS